MTGPLWHRDRRWHPADVWQVRQWRWGDMALPHPRIEAGQSGHSGRLNSGQPRVGWLPDSSGRVRCVR